MFKKNLLVMLCSLATILSFAAQKASEWQLLTPEYLYYNDQTHGDNNFKTGSYKVGINNSIDYTIINDMAMDEEGIAYFATNAGLYKFDGTKLSKMVIKGSKVASSVTRAVEIDNKGNLWIGTSEGLIKYFKGGFEEWDKETEGMDVRKIDDIVVRDDGTVFISGWKMNNGYKGSGLCVFDGTNWTTYNKDNSTLPKNFVEDLTLDDDGNVWMSVGLREFGLAKFDGENWEIFDKDNSILQTNVVRAIAKDNDGVMYFGTPRGLVIYDGKEWAEINFEGEMPINSKFLNKLKDFANPPDIYSMAFDQNNVLWIGTEESGVFRYTASSSTQMTTENSPLLSNAIGGIYVDKDNRKWFMSGFWIENWGDYFSGEENSISLISKFKGVASFKEPDYFSDPRWTVYNTWTGAFASNSFWEVEIMNGDVYATTLADGLLHLSKEGESTYYEPGSNVFGYRFTALGAAKDALWIGTNGKGLFKFSNGTFEKWDKDNSPIGELIKGVSVAPDGNVWFGNKKGLTEFDGNEFKFYDKSNTVMPSILVEHTYFDKDGNLWIGLQKAVIKYDGSNWELYDKKNGGLKGTRYAGILVRPDGDIWVGGQKGISTSTDGGQTFLPMPKIEGAPFYFVTSIAEDSKGNVYVGTSNKGLMKYSDGKWEVFTVDNSGIPFDNIIDVEVDENDIVWMTCDKSSSNEPNDITFPNETPDPAKEIRKKIKAFDPTGALVSFKP